MKPLDEGLRFISRAAHFLLRRAILTPWVTQKPRRTVRRRAVGYGAGMAKKGRRRRARRKNKANHGKRPNAGRKS
jgi:hypothetical protein